MYRISQELIKMGLESVYQLIIDYYSISFKDRTIRILEDFSNFSVNCVVTTNRIITGSDAKVLKIWDEEKCIKVLDGHKGFINCMALLPNGEIVSGSSDRTLIIWDHNGISNILRGHLSSIISVSTFKNRIASADSQEIKIWESGKCEKSLKIEGVVCITYFQDKIIIGRNDGSVYVWNYFNYKLLGNHNKNVNCLLPLDDNFFASGSSDNTIKIWTLNGCYKTLEGHTSSVESLTYLNGVLVSGSLDCKIKFWDYYIGKCIDTFAYKNIILSLGNLGEKIVVCSGFGGISLIT